MSSESQSGRKCECAQCAHECAQCAQSPKVLKSECAQYPQCLQCPQSLNLAENVNVPNVPNVLMNVPNMLKVPKCSNLNVPNLSNVLKVSIWANFECLQCAC